MFARLFVVASVFQSAQYLAGTGASAVPAENLGEVGAQVKTLVCDYE